MFLIVNSRLRVLGSRFWKRIAVVFILLAIAAAIAAVLLEWVDLSPLIDSFQR